MHYIVNCLYSETYTLVVVVVTVEELVHYQFVPVDK